jgi:hypothetical protein
LTTTPKAITETAEKTCNSAGNKRERKMIANDLSALLCLTTCDKCNKPMKTGDKIVIIAKGTVADVDDALEFQGTGVWYACHIDCWDGVEIDY